MQFARNGMCHGHIRSHSLDDGKVLGLMPRAHSKLPKDEGGAAHSNFESQDSPASPNLTPKTRQENCKSTGV